jgi:putative hydrolase of the HAD superfamily
MQGKPKNIIFDLGNVIVDIDEPRSYQELRALVAPDKEGEAEQKILQWTRNFEVGEMSSSEFVSALGDVMRSEVSSKEVINAWNAMLLDIPFERLRLMDRLRDRYAVYILSNTNALHLEWVNDFLQKNYKIESLDAVCDGAFYSHLLKDRKPERTIYEKMLNAAGLRASESVFYDDKPENVAAGLASGMLAKLSPRDIDIRLQCAVWL